MCSVCGMLVGKIKSRQSREILLFVNRGLEGFLWVPYHLNLWLENNRATINQLFLKTRPQYQTATNSAAAYLLCPNATVLFVTGMFSAAVSIFKSYGLNVVLVFWKHIP